MAYQKQMQMQARAQMPQPEVKKASGTMTYEAGGQTISLSPSTVRSYLVTGNPEKVTDQEIKMYMALCKYAGLNPWLRECYCIKYGNSPATLVVGKGAFEKRAEAHPKYDGKEAGIIVCDPNTGVVTYRTGSFRLPGEEIVGGWAEVWRTDRNHSTRIEVPMDEYIGRKSDGTVNSQWATKPGTMIRKVALVQALREAFPASFQGMYDAAEMGVDENVLDVDPITPPDQERTEVILPDSAVPSEAANGPTPEQLNQRARANAERQTIRDQSPDYQAAMGPQDPGPAATGPAYMSIDDLM